MNDTFLQIFCLMRWEDTLSFRSYNTSPFTCISQLASPFFYIHQISVMHYMHCTLRLLLSEIYIYFSPNQFKLTGDLQMQYPFPVHGFHSILAAALFQLQSSKETRSHLCSTEQQHVSIHKKQTFCNIFLHTHANLVMFNGSSVAKYDATELTTWCSWMSLLSLISRQLELLHKTSALCTVNYFFFC